MLQRSPTMTPGQCGDSAKDFVCPYNKQKWKIRSISSCSRWMRWDRQRNLPSQEHSISLTFPLRLLVQPVNMDRVGINQSSYYPIQHFTTQVGKCIGLKDHTAFTQHLKVTPAYIHCDPYVTPTCTKHILREKLSRILQNLVKKKLFSLLHMHFMHQCHVGLPQYCAIFVKSSCSLRKSKLKVGNDQNGSVVRENTPHGH